MTKRGKSNALSKGDMKKYLGGEKRGSCVEGKRERDHLFYFEKNAQTDKAGDNQEN